MSTSDWNGFQLCGKILPDIALENLLASVPIEEILKLREVWNSILPNETFCLILFNVVGMSSMAGYNFATHFLENCIGTEWNRLDVHTQLHQGTWKIVDGFVCGMQKSNFSTKFHIESFRSP